MTSQPGDAIWLREGIFIAKEIPDSGIPIGVYLNKPKCAIFLERHTINSVTYIRTYIDNIGERLIEESEILSLK